MRSSLSSQHVVRLGAPPARMSSVVLSSYSSPRPTGEPIRLSQMTLGQGRARSAKIVLASMAHAVDEPEEIFLASRSGGGFFGRFVAFLIAPMIVLQPILPLYAADESIAPLPLPALTEAEAIPPPPPLIEVLPSEEAPSDPASSPSLLSTEESVPEENPIEEVIPVDPSVDESMQEEHISSPSDGSDPDTSSPVEPTEDVDPALVPDQSVEEPVPPPVDSGEAVPAPSEEAPTDPALGGDVLGVATTTEAGTDVEEVVPADEHIGGGGGASVEEGATASSTPTSPEEQVGTTTEIISASSEDGAVGAEMSTPEEAATSDGQEQVDVAAREEAKAEELRQKEEEARVHEEILRRDLRKEVEAEFTKGCVSIDQSGYYCLKDTEHGWSGELAPSTGVTAISSETDGKGADKEIFVTKGGQKLQLTDNEQEDAFPAFDFDGSTVVWQEMNNGRWQIFYALVASGTPEVHQLTNSTESNFNPTVHSGVITWQGWVDGNWEIFLAIPRTGEPALSMDQLTPEHHLVGVNGEWDVQRLTMNTTHDMFPAIAGDLVTWQSYEAGNWGIVAYSLKTDTMVRVSDSAKKSERPRFALLWNEEGDGGNVHMKGYDIASGQTTDLTNEAKRVPDIPKHVPAPIAPISGPDQAALPPVTVHGSVAPQKDDGDAEDEI